MNIFVRAIVMGASSLTVVGCATVMNGTSQPIEFSSDPSGAKVELVTGLKCETPCQYSMKRGNDSAVTFSKDGYRSELVYIQSRTSAGTAGNILAGGIIGGVIDGANGASNHLYPDSVSIRLVPIGSSEPAVLLDKNGKVISTVAEFNARVAADVNEGLQEQGLRPMGAPAITSGN